jgi:pimeloyl-ACP methyl ester carboxylesterase
MSFTQNTVFSSDGTVINYETTGTGPGLIIVHGALSNAWEYASLAMELSNTFTVHLIQRRGRQPITTTETYSIENECEDLLAVQHATQAKLLFGHSFGGLIALETARKRHPFQKIALYEPGVSINTDWTWITEYSSKLENEKYRGAFTSFVRGMGHTPLSKMPKWLAYCILRLAIRGDDWKLKQSLLTSNLREHREVMRLEGTYRQYSHITVPVLLAYGQSSPSFMHQMMKILSGSIQGSQVQVLPKQTHLAPENGNAPSVVADCLIAFFAGDGIL